MLFQHPFYFLRHGETHHNQHRMVQGQFDSKLNPTGFAQAQRAAEILENEPITRIVSSPLSRAKDTADIVAARHGLAVETDPCLMECHFGKHQDRPSGDWFDEFFAGRYDPPGGETFPDFCERVWQAMARTVSQADTLIVAHGGLWIAAQTRVSIRPSLPRLANAVPLHVTPGEDGWTQRVLGDSPQRLRRNAM